MNARWRIRPHDPARILGLSRAAGISPLVAQLLINRGIDEPEQAVLFLEARLGSLTDPELIPGAVEAAERIVRAIRDDRKIVIYGDYDVDGVCGTSILWACLRLAGADDAEYYIPHRVEEGYGVNAEALRRLARRGRGDADRDGRLRNIRRCAKPSWRGELGVELIITDHHTIGLTLAAGRRDRPSALARWSGYVGATSAGRALHSSWPGRSARASAMANARRLTSAIILMRSLGLVALATIADIVPLSDENRVMVRRGLAGIAQSPTVGPPRSDGRERFSRTSGD